MKIEEEQIKSLLRNFGNELMENELDPKQIIKRTYTNLLIILTSIIKDVSIIKFSSDEISILMQAKNILKRNIT